MVSVLPWCYEMAGKLAVQCGHAFTAAYASLADAEITSHHRFSALLDRLPCVLQKVQYLHADPIASLTLGSKQMLGFTRQ